MSKLLLCLLIFGVLTYTLWEKNNKEEMKSNRGDEKKQIFILAGQSNMAGRGGVIYGSWNGVLPRECQSNPRILRLNADLRWEEAHEPLHKDIDVKKTCGVGPGMAFGNMILEKDSNFGTIYLVPCAWGGASLSDWAKGSILYNNLVKRAGEAVKIGGKIRGILWFQGEIDAMSLEAAKSYRTKLERFIKDLRIDLGSSQLPFYQVAIPAGQGPYFEMVRAAQLEFNLQNVITVDAKGLQLQNDGLHLSSSAHVLLGEMLADAVLGTVVS